jgi:hypothetical protein
MLEELLKTKIEDMLLRMGCKSIVFSNGQPDKATVRFDCDTLLSFTVDVDPWKYSGIQPNTEGSQKYKIEFRR